MIKTSHLKYLIFKYCIELSYNLNFVNQSVFVSKSSFTG